MSSARKDLAALFEELVELTILHEKDPQSFRVRAYENAVPAIRSLPSGFEELSASALAKRRGIGKSTAAKIREFLETGSIAKLDKLRVEYPKSVVEMSRLPGVGPKTVAKLRKELEVHSIDDLSIALDEHRLQALGGFGAKSEDRLREAIDRARSVGDERAPIARALPIARRIVEALQELPQVLEVQYCGSLRRMRETIGDIDILVAAKDAAPVMEAFATLNVVESVIARGGTKTSVVTSDGMQVDLRVVEPDSFGAAVVYFTGSKAHNIKLRQLAIERGWILNEYSLADKESGEVVASKTEEDVYRALELTYVPPPMREDTGEVELASKGELPAVVRVEDLRGDLHVHTELSGDGRSPLDEVISRAVERGYAYIAITDHAEDLPRFGVDRERIRAQRDTIERARHSHPDIQILHGVELNIGPDGGLDWDEEFRAWFDFCLAAVHSHFDQDQATQTNRILRAMDDPAVTAIGHLSGRMIGKRKGIDLDIDAVLQKAAETGVAIEINSSLPRLDAPADVLRRARELDVTFTIGSDAHHVIALGNTRWGALQSQRGWVDRDRVANTWDADRFLSWVAARRPS